MWKYILASILLVIGIPEIVQALHKGLRDAFSCLDFSGNE